MGSFSDFSRQSSDPTAKATAKATNLGLQFIAIGVLLAALAIATGVAPVSWIKLERSEGRVRARVQSCFFFVIPYQTVWIDPVEKLDTRIQTGSQTRRNGRDVPNSKAEDTGYLKIEGPSGNTEVPIAPSSLQSVKQKAQAFIADPKSTELQLFVVASWLFSFVFSGLATLFGLIIAGSFVVAFAQWVLKKLGMNRKSVR